MVNWGGTVVEGRQLAEERSGYGYSKHIDCNSALALIGFILFIDILRDIIAGLPVTGRRRRDAAPWEASLTEVRQSSFAAPFLSGAAVEDLVRATPGLLAAIGAEQWEAGVPGPCARLALCEKGERLASRHGAAGRLLYTLYTNVLSRVFSGGEPSLEGTLLEAARAGRTRQDCAARYPDCRTRLKDMFGDLPDDPDDYKGGLADVAKKQWSKKDCDNVSKGKESNHNEKDAGDLMKRRDDSGYVLKTVRVDHVAHDDIYGSIDDGHSNDPLTDSPGSI